MYRDAPKPLPRFRRMSTVAIALCSSALGAVGCADLGSDTEAKQSYAIYYADDFETASNPPANWAPTNNASEWSLDTTTGAANNSYRRNDASGSGAWSQSLKSGTYGQMTVTADMIVDSWKGVTGEALAVYARYNDNSQGPSNASWYGAVLTSDGNVSIQKRRDGGAVTNLATLNNVQVQPGVWFTARIEVSDVGCAADNWKGYTRIGVYINNVFQGSYYDDGTAATSGTATIPNGSGGLGSMGVNAMWDNVSLGDQTEVLLYEMACSATTHTAWDAENGSESGEAL
jgi:hypothetical protein